MRSLISPKQMLDCERACFDSGYARSIDMMETAAGALTDAACEMAERGAKVYIACGPGGNGGDGYACARLLKERGYSPVLIAASPARSADCRTNADRAAACAVPVCDRAPDAAPDLWVDCLYGTGLDRCPEGSAAELIALMNGDVAPVLACDIPSGLNGRNGKAYDVCVHANRTVTFQYGKFGHFLEDGLDVCGEITVADIGFPAKYFPAELPRLFTPGDIAPLFPPRRRNIHKGHCGHLLIVAGSVGMAGAAVLCARAALRSGAGLVSIACPEEIVPILQISAPQAMCIPLPQKDGALSADGANALTAAMRGKTAVAAGCGWSRRTSPEILRRVLNSSLPTVIDADALNILTEYSELTELLGPNHILTPHIGEAARLLGRTVADPVSDAAELAKNGCTAVLKSASRVISDSKDTYISTSGACGMARGGSGDIFCGILGALLAEKSGRSVVQTAAAACELHGLCGMAAQEKYGARAMNSADMLEFLPEVLKRYANS